MKRQTVWVVVAVMAVGGVAWGQDKPKKEVSADDSLVPTQPAAVETRTYNVADLVRTTADYPFESAIRPATGWDNNGTDPAARVPMGGKEEKGKRAADAAGRMGIEGLFAVLENNIEPESWRDNGGTIGSIQTLGSLLVVTQSPQNHKRIEELLGMIRKEYGPLKMVGVRVWWVEVDPAMARELFGAAKGAAGVLDEGAIAKLPAEVVWAEGRTSCFSGQTVHVASGRGRTVVEKANPVVGTGAALYDAQTELVQSGAVLQVTPLLSPDGQTAVLDVASVVSEWDKPDGDKVDVAGVVDTGATSRPTGSVDRVNVGVQQMRTTVRVPVGKPVVVGGMTKEAGVDQRQVFLVAEVRGE